MSDVGVYLRQIELLESKLIEVEMALGSLRVEADEAKETIERLRKWVEDNSDHTTAISAYGVGYTIAASDVEDILDGTDITQYYCEDCNDYH